MNARGRVGAPPTSSPIEAANGPNGPNAGIVIREASDLAELEEISLLLSRIWDRSPESRQVTVSLLRALSITGNYVAAAFEGDQVVGAAIGFHAPQNDSLHSHITGVDPRSHARNVGFLLKSHQRTWALAHHIQTISWTFDPLIRRNAYFNLVKLGARATRYLPDFYGPMHDGLNRGEESDRLLVEWELESQTAKAAAEGARQEPHPSSDFPTLIEVTGYSLQPAVWSGGPALVPVPEDIERVRAEDPKLAQAWRSAVRGVLGAALDSGAQVTGFDRTHGYLIDNSSAPLRIPADSQTGTP